VLADGEAWAVGEGGTVLRRREGRWLAAETITSASLRAVSATAPNDVWIAGGGGTVVHFDGARLTAVESGTTTTLRGAFARAPNDVWFVGESGEILHFDGAKMTKEGEAPDSLHAVWASGPGDVWAVGGTLNVGTIGHFVGGRWSFQTSGLSGAGWNAVSGVAADDVWIAGNYGRIAHYDGKRWTETPRALGSFDANGVVATGRDEAYFIGGGSLFGFFEGKVETYPGATSGNALAVSKGGELLFVGDGGKITRGVQSEAIDEVAGATDAVFSVTSAGHVLVQVEPYGENPRLVDLTTKESTPYDSSAVGPYLAAAEDGTPIVDRSLSAGTGAAYSYAEGGRWVDVPRPTSVPSPPGIRYWSGTMLAAASKDDVWYGSAQETDDRRSVASLVHYVRGTYTSIVLPSECLSSTAGSTSRTLDAAVRPLPGGDAIVACGCLVARVRGGTLEPPTAWTCERPARKDGYDGFLGRPTRTSLMVDGDTILVAHMIGEYAYTGDWVYYSYTPVVDRIVKGTRERIVLPDGMTSTHAGALHLARAPSGRPALYLEDGDGRTANMLEIEGARATPKRIPIGHIAAVYSTNGGTYLSNGVGLLRAR